MTKRKTIAGVVVLTIAVIGGVIGGGYWLTGGSRKSFPADGYVLEVKSDDSAQTAAGITFASGTTYQGKFPASVTFKDIGGQRNIVKEASYVHYADGSISSFTDGMVVNMEDASSGFLEFYRVEANMVMSNTGEGWQIDNNGNNMDFGEMLWQLSKDKVLTASDSLTLELPGKEPEKLSGYLEVLWLDKDIVQVANQEQVYQTIASDGKITYGSGAVLDFKEKAVKGPDGTVRFTLDELLADMEDGGIEINSESNVNWKPPEFNIQIENGKDGETGEDGDAGEVGDAGQAGAAGEAGEAGEDGEEGDEGEEGQEGDEGDTGGQGGNGQSGTAGVAGERGASPGAGGQNPSTSNAQELGIIRISDLEYDCAEGKVQLSVLDDDFTLREGRVEIRNVKTNQLVDSAVVNFADGMTTKEVAFKNLVADQEYALIVKSDYSISLPSGINAGTKTFVNRSFFTSAEGVTMEVDSVKEGELNLKLTTRPDSDAVYFKILAKVGDKADQIRILDYPIGNVGELQNYGNELLNLDLAEQGAQLGELWGSDIPYTLELYTSSGRVLNDGDWELDENGNFIGLNKENGIKKSNYTISGRTLKEKPVLGKLNTTLTQDGYYDMELEVVSDKDNSIREYVYEIIPQGSNEPVRTLTSTKSRVNWYYSGDVSMGGSYKIRASVRYYDNEKSNVMSTQEQDLFVNAPDKAGVGFERFSTTYDENQVPQNFVNSRGDKVSNAVGGMATNASRIWGELLLYPNGRVIGTDIRIEVTSNDDTQYRNVIEAKLPAAAPSGSDPYYINVKCLGLKEDTAYLFSVYGTSTREIQTGAGSTVTDKKEDELLGSVTVATSKMSADYTENAHPTAAAFALTSAVSDNAGGTIAAIRLYQPEDSAARFKDINSRDKASPFYFERSSARAIEFTIRSATDNSVLGKAVKDLYKTDPGVSVKDESAQTQIDNPNYVTEAEADFYNGPLTAWNWTDPIYLTVQDIETTGTRFPISQNFGKYVLEATALYDYSYKMMDDYQSYRGKFMDTNAENYNRIPLTEVKLDIVGDNNSLNRTVVDMGIRPPELIDPPDEAVTATQIPNDGTEISYQDPTLDVDTTVAVKVQSNYPNRNSDTRSITYYGMTLTDFEDFESNYSGYGVSQRDIIEAYEQGNAQAQKVIKFKVTIEIGAQSDAGVPPLYVVMTDDEKLLDSCREKQGNDIVGYKTVDDREKKVFYTDTIKRGDCYVFPFTLESYYGVDTSSGGDPQPWVFPYGLGEKTGVPYLGGKNLQRSHGTNIYKEKPRVAAYLDHTDVEAGKDKAVWRFYIYDPDGAWLDAGKTVMAGEEAHLLQDLSVPLGSGVSSNALLKTEAGTVTFINHPITNNQEAKYVAERSFKLSRDKGWKKDRFGYFDVTVEDGTNKLLRNFSGNYYEVWLSIRQFTGKLGVDENPTTNPEYDFEEFVKTRLTAQGGTRLGSEEYFAVRTVQHRFDFLADNAMKDLKVTVSLKEGSTELYLNLHENTPQTERTHLVGFYYEIHNYNKSTGTKGNLEQWGVIPYSGNNQASEMTIPLSEPAQAEDIHVAINAIYDTGKAGLNLNEVISEVDEVAAQRGKGDKPEAEARKEWKTNNLKYYAIQQQNAPMYAISGNNAGLSYPNEYAADSLFQYKEDEDLETSANPLFADDNWVPKVAHILHYPGFYGLQYQYGSTGAVIADKTQPVFKQLKETKITLIETTGIHKISGEDNGIWTTVPATIPNVVVGSNDSSSPLSVDVNITLEGKSNDLLVLDNGPTDLGVYSKEIYFELYEYTAMDSNDKPDLTNATPLPNDDNRYFDITRNQETGFANEWGQDPHDGKNKAYMTAANANKESGYRIAVRNLETDKKYCLKLYCYDKAGNKVYLLDHRPSNGKGGELVMPFSVTDVIRIGSSSSIYTGLTADYKQTDYEAKRVNTGYTLDKRRGYYLEYEITNASDNPEFGMDDLMRVYGYTKKEERSYWYYDNGWKEAKYNVYLSEQGTEFSYTDTSKTLSFIFSEQADLNRFMPEQKYKFKIKAYALNGKSLRYRTGSDSAATTSTTPPEAEFTVPPRVDPSYNVMVSYTKTGSDTTATLTVTVHDDGFYLRAWPNNGNAVENGSYILKLMKGTTEMNAGGGYEIEPVLSANGMLSKGQVYKITYTVTEGIQYRVQILGQNTRISSGAGNDILYDSDNAPALKQQLLLSNLATPQLGTVIRSFDTKSEAVVIRSINGLNLSLINRISISLTNLSSYQSRSDIRSASFTQTGNRAEMRIMLADLLDEVGAKEGDDLILTVRFSDGVTDYQSIDESFAFTY